MSGDSYSFGDGDGGAFGEKGGVGLAGEDFGDFRAVMVDGVAGEAGLAGHPDSPLGMLNFVFEAAAFALGCVTPIVFGDELGFGAFGGQEGFSCGFNAHLAAGRAGAPGVFSIGDFAVWAGLDCVGHGDSGVALVEGEAGDGGDGEFGDELADEDGTALLAAANVEADVDLFKVLMERDGEAEDAGAVELEADEAEPGFVGEEVEFGAGGDVGLEQGGIDCVVEHEQVEPFGG